MGGDSEESEQAIDGHGDVESDESDAGGISGVFDGEDTAEEPLGAAVGARRGGHGLEVGPGGLLHEAVPDRDGAGGGHGGGARRDQRRRRKDVSEGGV